MSTSEESLDDTATQHIGTENLAINNTFFRRSWLLFKYKLLRQFRMAKYAGNCLLLSERLIVKTGPYIHLTEVTMQYLAQNTSIPIPKVYSAFVHRNQAYIVMERLPGVELSTAWPNLSEAQLKSISGQLRQMLDELIALTSPPGTGVQSCIGGSLYDFRIPYCQPRMGPFMTMQEFHLFIRHGLQPESHPDRKRDQAWLEIEAMAAKQDGPWPPPVFTHGDLNASNILVDGDKVVGIIDWESAGWYPHY